MNRKEAEKQIADIMYHALKGDITEKEMHDQTFEVLKKMDKKPKVICVTGGKGGTGKTLVAVNLATMFRNEGKKVLLIDGDVENPNTYLL